MGLGILESSQIVVAGTIQLFDTQDAGYEASAHLKHTPDGKLILAPQPSDSPNDPLNWSILKKDLQFFVLLMDCGFSGVHAAILSPVTIELREEFNVSIIKIAQLSSNMLLMIACVAYLLAALANIYGKRAIFVACIAIMLASDAWASKAGSYSSLLGARMLSGVGESGFSTLALAVVADLYFVHQRSKRILAFLFFSTSGVYLGVVIIGQVIGDSSWRMAFAGIAIAEGVMLVLTFFVFEETQYNRPHIDPLAHVAEDAILEKVHNVSVHTEPASDTQTSDTETNTVVETRKTYLQRLNLYGGRMSQNNFFLLLYRSIALTFHPTILYATCFTILYSWDAGVSFTIDAFMSIPPYNFSTQAVSNMFLAPWLGTLLAAVLGEPVMRWMANLLTRRNHNVYEPEFRLFGSIPGIIFGIIGCIGWGWGEQDTIAWIGLAFFNGFMAAGAVLMNATGVGYIIDAHREFANESQVILFSLRSFFAFAMGYYLIDWWESVGPKAMWSCITATFVGTALLGILVYIYGKRMRAFWSRHRFLWIPNIKQ